MSLFAFSQMLSVAIVVLKRINIPLHSAFFVLRSQYFCYRYFSCHDQFYQDYFLLVLHIKLLLNSFC